MSTLDRRDRGDMIMTYNILNNRVEMNDQIYENEYREQNKRT